MLKTWDNLLSHECLVGTFSRDGMQERPKLQIQGCFFFVRDVPGDGNCVFHCLSLCTDIDSIELRSQMAMFMHSSIGRIFVLKYHKKFGHQDFELRDSISYDKYVAHVASAKEPIGPRELCVLSLILKRNIVFYRRKASASGFDSYNMYQSIEACDPVFAGSFVWGDSISMLYHVFKDINSPSNPNHFALLIPAWPSEDDKLMSYKLYSIIRKPDLVDAYSDSDEEDTDKTTTTMPDFNIEETDSTAELYVDLAGSTDMKTIAVGDAIKYIVSTNLSHLPNLCQSMTYNSKGTINTIVLKQSIMLCVIAKVISSVYHKLLWHIRR